MFYSSIRLAVFGWTLSLVTSVAAAAINKDQVYRSATAYDRSHSEALEAAQTLQTTLAFQVYLSASTPSYYRKHQEALEAAVEIDSYLGLQIYLSLLTPSYKRSHKQALEAATAMTTTQQLQRYLHFLVIGMRHRDALSQSLK